MQDGTELARARTGVFAVVFAFLAWGVLPVYWKQLEHVPSAELLAHRIVWTLVFGTAVVALTRRWTEVRRVLRSWRSRACFLLAGVFLGINWYTFIDAVNTGHVVECSLGYYINPLVNILFGGLFLRERFRAWQLIAILLACLGVLNLTINYGRFPWIALVLAGSFGLYALLRKKAGYEAITGLFLEMCVLVLPASTYLLLLGAEGRRAFSGGDLASWILIPGTGVVTALPLLAFTFGTRRIRLSTVGFIQYLTPTGMFLLGVFLYGETFTTQHLVTFGCIWAGLGIYTFEALVRARRPTASPPDFTEGAAAPQT